MYQPFFVSSSSHLLQGRYRRFPPAHMNETCSQGLPPASAVSTGSTSGVRVRDTGWSDACADFLVRWRLPFRPWRLCFRGDFDWPRYVFPTRLDDVVCTTFTVVSHYHIWWEWWWWAVEEMDICEYTVVTLVTRGNRKRDSGRRYCK